MGASSDVFVRLFFVCLVVYMKPKSTCNLHRSLSSQEGLVKKLCEVLELVGNFGNSSATHHLTAHLFAAAHVILRVAPPTESEL